MCQMIIKHYICPVLRPRKGISELESAGDSNDCKTGGSVRLHPRIPFALAMGVCQALYKYKERIPSQAGAPFNKNEKTNINIKIRFLLLMF
jgi:hypothetical protein